MTPEAMAALTTDFLDHFADTLRHADPAQLAHEAERAETLPRSPLGNLMRQLVDAERASRASGATALSATSRPAGEEF